MTPSKAKAEVRQTDKKFGISLEMQNVTLLIVFSPVSCLCVKCPLLAPIGSVQGGADSAARDVSRCSPGLAAGETPILFCPEQPCSCSRIPAKLVLQSTEMMWWCWTSSSKWMPQICILPIWRVFLDIFLILRNPLPPTSLLTKCMSGSCWAVSQQALRVLWRALWHSDLVAPKDFILN